MVLRFGNSSHALTSPVMQIMVIEGLPTTF